jgi:hypothetical protein
MEPARERNAQDRVDSAIWVGNHSVDGEIDTRPIRRQNPEPCLAFARRCMSQAAALYAQRSNAHWNIVKRNAMEPPGQS